MAKNTQILTKDALGNTKIYRNRKEFDTERTISRPKTYKIKYPDEECDVELQAYLFCGLKRKKIDARLSVKAMHSQFDMAVFHDKRCILIIDVKKYRKTTSYEDKLRFLKYEKFDVPVWKCPNRGSVHKIIKKLGCKEAYNALL